MLEVTDKIKKKRPNDSVGVRQLFEENAEASDEEGFFFLCI